MSQRTHKVASLIQQVVAQALIKYQPGVAPQVTVTTVEVSPDLRQATIWLGILRGEAATVLKSIESSRRDIQAEVAANMTTKFTPRLEFRHDASGAYAEHIDRLIKDL